MDLNDLAHQCYSDNKAWFPEKANDLVHHVLGLSGESGEVANIVKKLDRGTITLDEVRKDLAEELIDVMIYTLSAIAILGVDPNAVWDIKRAKNKQRFNKNGEQA